jgi:phospholipase/lecithinase/hemolysin
MAIGFTDISNLVVFGDSLSDNGNLFALFGLSSPHSWEGRASNGPVYAEQLAQLLGLQLDDRAFAGAEASDSSPPVLPISPLINLPHQVAGYIAQLGGNSAPLGTAALINIGSNDYDAYFQSNLPKDPQGVHNFVTSVVGSIEQAIDALTDAGIEKIILFTLPDFGAALLGGPPQVAMFAHNLALANNTALEQMAASHPNVQVVDVFPLTDAIFTDPHSFGFTAPLNLTWVSLLEAQSTQFAPNEVAFFGGVHPTTAAHGIVAAFADAVLTSDHVQFLDGTQTIIHAQNGTNFIFATNDPFHPVLNQNYTIYGGSGTDLIFAGPGNVTVYGGRAQTSSPPVQVMPRFLVVTGRTCSKPIRPGSTSWTAGEETTRSSSIAQEQIPFLAIPATTFSSSRRVRSWSIPMALSISGNRSSMAAADTTHFGSSSMIRISAPKAL